MIFGKIWSCCPRDPTTDKRLKMDGWNSTIEHVMFLHCGQETLHGIKSGVQIKIAVGTMTIITI